MIQSVSAAGPGTYVVAASDSSSSWKSQADYVCDGAGDQVEIQAAINRLPSTGGTVTLGDGTFTCAGGLSVKDNAALRGQGIDKTTLKVTAASADIILGNGATTSDFTLTGSGGIRVSGSHVRVTNIKAYKIDNTQLAAFTIYKWNSLVEDVVFQNCYAIETGSWGFNVDAEGDIHLVKDVCFLNCQAIDIGKGSQFYGTNPPQADAWNVGFSIAENADVQNVLLNGCLAERCWESGFHAEIARSKQNVTIEDCISRDNGQKEKTGWGPAEYGAGFLASSDMHLINCTSVNNIIGFMVNSGSVSISGSSDTGSRYGFLVQDVRDPSGVTVSDVALTGEDYAFNIASKTGLALTPFTVDRASISAGPVTKTSPAVLVQSNVPDADRILFRNSAISGYRTGIQNNGAGLVQVESVSVTGATTNFVRCNVLAEPTLRVDPLSTRPKLLGGGTPEPTVTVTPTPVPSPVTTAVTQATGPIRFTSQPSGAAVSVDGKAIGKTPVSVNLTTGSHALSMALAGYAPWSMNVVLTKADFAVQRSYNPKLLALTPTPQPALQSQKSGTIRFTSQPQGASVSVDGKVIGKTPVSVDLSAGNHIFSMTLAGYAPWSMRATLTSQDFAIQRSYNPVLTRVFVATRP